MRPSGKTRRASTSPSSSSGRSSASALELLVVEEARRQVELGLDVGLVAVRPDERGVAARAEQEPDRLREDRLAGAGLAGDRVQPGRELELGLADEDEVLDAEPAKHAWMLRPPAAGGDPPKPPRPRRVHVHARPWVGGG